MHNAERQTEKGKNYWGPELGDLISGCRGTADNLCKASRIQDKGHNMLQSMLGQRSGQHNDTSSHFAA